MKIFFKVLCLAVLIAVSLGAVQRGEGEFLLSRDDLQPAMIVQEHYTDALMSNPEIVGTAVGADENGNPVIKVYMRHGHLNGESGVLDGMPFVIEATGEFTARQRDVTSRDKPPGKGGGGGGDGGGGEVDPTARFPRPVPIGVSTGHPDVTAGTIGCRVTDGANVYALSNNHVYADENAASPNDVVIQPGTFDGGTLADDIGTLSDFEPIDFSGADNVIDAAIAATTTSLVGNSTPSDGYGTPVSTTAAAAINLKVMKYGRTTGQTNGRVSGLNATVNVGYSTGTARFVNQIVIGGGSFSAGGDSGSLIVVQKGADAGQAVGLLFAGSINSTIANPIDAVLSAFGVTVDGQVDGQ